MVQLMIMPMVGIATTMVGDTDTAGIIGITTGDKSKKDQVLLGEPTLGHDCELLGTFGTDKNNTSKSWVGMKFFIVKVIVLSVIAVCT